MDDINLVIARCIDVDRLDQEKIYVSKRIPIWLISLESWR